MQQPIMTTTPVNQPMPTAAQEKKPKVEREEMWLITAAKSKTMRFFAVSCEFIIFIGCLWLTLVTILPSATGWFNGGIDNFFLIAMGFAVDAALPEAWLHVVDQYTDTPKKTTQLKWSIPIAIGMLLLVGANFVYAKLVGTSGAAPTGSLATVVDVLLIARMFIGISYVTIRECQSFLNRKQLKTKTVQETDERITTGLKALQETFETRLTDVAVSQQEQVAKLQANYEQRLVAFASEQVRSLAAVQTAQSNTPTIDFEEITRHILSVQSEQTTALEIDQTAIVNAVIEHFSEQFEQGMKRLTEQRVQVTMQPQAPAIPEHLNTQPNSKQPLQQDRKIVRLAPVNRGVESHQDTIIRLLEEDETRGPRELARLAGCSPATAKNYRDLHLGNRSVERNGTED